MRVSIHAAQAGCDPWRPRYFWEQSSFNSRSPSGLRPRHGRNTLHLRCFNSRSPSGLRLACAKKCCYKLRFNSRSPSGLRPAHVVGVPIRDGVSIHAAQAGCDVILTVSPMCPVSFNSRSPSGLRLKFFLDKLSYVMFQFTQPKRAATPVASMPGVNVLVSIHAAQAGCDTLPVIPDQTIRYVSIHAAQAGCDSE